MWRVLTCIPGISRDTLENNRQAREAGALLGRFHSAVSDLDHTFSNPRLGVHDTAAHLENLRRALASHGDHPQFDRVEPIAERILDMAGQLPELPLTRERIVHGDPKISNVIFDPDTDEAVCLVDLDTVAFMPVILELGDAFRSWCNPLGEDTRETTFSMPLFRAALAGYAGEAGDLLSGTSGGRCRPPRLPSRLNWPHGLPPTRCRRAISAGTLPASGAPRNTTRFERRANCAWPRTSASSATR